MVQKKLLIHEEKSGCRNDFLQYRLESMCYGVKYNISIVEYRDHYVTKRQVLRRHSFTMKVLIF